MFTWLHLYYPICGRIRRSDGDDGGRPYVKCNDSGIRIVVAKCVKTVAEWRQLEMDGDEQELQQLVYSTQSLQADDDFGFRPLVFLQLTDFKCGGMSVGMSWAHILGDAFSASECINMWGNMITNTRKPPRLLNNVVNTQKIIHSPTTTSSLRSVKLLGDDNNNNRKMQKHTFHVSEKLLSEYLVQYAGDKINDYKGHVKPFELISAVIWKSLAKVRGTDSGLKIVTLCKKAGENEVIIHQSNRNQVIGIVEAISNLSVAEVNSLDLAILMVESFVDETEMIEKVMMEEDQDDGKVDFMVYGANLTFVNLEEVDLYGMEVKGQKPRVTANSSISRVGDGGAVVVLPSGGGGGRIVNVILPEFEIKSLKDELKVEWGIF